MTKASTVKPISPHLSNIECPDVLPAQTQQCSKCGRILPLSEFYKEKRRKLGIRANCKECQRQYVNGYCHSSKGRITYQARIESGRYAEAKKRYRSSEKGKRTEREYLKRKLRDDLCFKIGYILRIRLNESFKKERLPEKGMLADFLGCSFEFLKHYIEEQFKPGMAWTNRGHKTWHIDHKTPLARFDLTDPEQLALACHYTNLQPLWAGENLSKGTR